MFYQRDGKWGVFPHKISFYRKEVIFDLQTEGYEEDEDLHDIVVEDVVLTDKQQERYELIRNASNLTMAEIEEFVMNDDIMETNFLMTDLVNKARVQKEIESYIKWDEMTQEAIDTMLGAYELWSPLQTYTKGKIVQYGMQLYEVRDFHVSQETWFPDVTAFYYKPIGVPGTVKQYEERDGSNPYMIGDPVIFEEELYICIVDYTTWSPKETPNNWKKDVPEGVVEDWVQKTYFKGEEVMFEGVHYVSIFEGHNVWSPGAYPSGWEVVPK